MGRPIPLWQAFLVGVVLIAALIWEIVYIGTTQAQIAMVLTAIFAAIIAMINGWKWSVLEEGMTKYIAKALQYVIVLMLVVLMKSAWIAGGIIPTIVYYGIDFISPTAFLFMVFILCCLVSFCTGYSCVLAGAVGIIFIDLGIAFGFSPGVVTGAVVSGVYFGENMSPFSDAVNIQAASAGVELYEHIKYAFRTGIPAVSISALLYLILGFSNKGTDHIYVMTEKVTEGIAKEFIVSPFFLLAPLLVLGVAFFCKLMLPALFAGFMTGVLCMFLQGEAVKTLFDTLIHGAAFDDPFLSVLGMENALPSNIFVSMGLEGMLWTMTLLICAMALGGVMNTTGMLQSLAEYIISFAKTDVKLITATVTTCIWANLVVMDQYLAIILPGVLYKEAYLQKGVDIRKLSRCLGDAGAVTSCLVPWNRCGIIMTAMLGVDIWGTDGYGIYAFFCWLCPIINIIYSKLDVDRRLFTT